MPYKTGYVDNNGSEGSAHWQMLDTIRRFACGYGTAAAPAFTGAGNGTLGSIDTHPATLTETITVTCTDATTPGAEAWSVSGGTTGALANAITGVAYTSAVLDFTIAAGSTAFQVGDAFTVATTQGDLSAAGQAWTELRYDTTSNPQRELILRGAGLSGTDQIFIGLRTYEDASADYYNLSTAGFTGYVAGNTFDTQPGYIESGIPGHNQRIDYWLAVNGQRIVFGLKVGTPVYEHGYAGFFLPYATPGQYSYPLAVGGMLNGLAPTRYSDTAHSMPYKGNRVNLRMRFVDGTWKQPDAWPWDNTYLAGSTLSLRDTSGGYPLLPVTLSDSGNLYGELDGVRQVTGFNNVVENTVTIGGTDHVVLQDVSRTGFPDYVALEMS